MKPKKPKLGRPRRGSTTAEVSTVRIDEASKELLQYEFGSLGSALYFVADGIARFRQKHGIGRGGTTENVEVPGSLDFRDLVLLRDILWYRVDRWRGDAKAIAPTVALLRKLERMLYSESVFYQSPPPIARDPVSEGVPIVERPKIPRIVYIAQAMARAAAKVSMSDTQKIESEEDDPK